MSTLQETLQNIAKELEKAAPGPPPRPGLRWREATHRWISSHFGHKQGPNVGSMNDDELDDHIQHLREIDTKLHPSSYKEAEALNTRPETIKQKRKQVESQLNAANKEWERRIASRPHALAMAKLRSVMKMLQS